MEVIPTKQKMKFFGMEITKATSPAVVAAEPVVERRSLLGGMTFPEEVSAGFRASNLYQQSAWVYRAIGVLAEQVANMPFRFSRLADPHTIVQSEKLTAFYNQPHPMLNRFSYWELKVMWLMLRGECFRIPVYGRDGRLDRVMILDPDKFDHIVEGGAIVGWRYRDGDPKAPVASQVFLPEEVWHDRLANPYDHWRGFPPLAVARVAAEADFAAGQLMRGLFENNGEPGMIVRTDEQLDPEQREQLLQACAERRRGGGRAPRPLLLWGGAEVVTPTLQGVDSKFIDSRRFSVTEICAAFGVPEEIISTTVTSKFDVLEGTRRNFLENRVVPLCRRLECEEARVVRAVDPGMAGWFDVDEHPVIMQARRERLTAAKVGFDMGIPFNALNESLNLGFKDLPWGDRGYVGRNMVEVGGERRAVES